MCLLYLIRHGATANNEASPPRLQGRRADPGLSAHGLEQAQRTARWLAGQRFDAVYSSPLLRARQTADEIAAALRLTVELVDDLIEVDVGRWEGLAWEDIKRRDPEAYRLFMDDASVHPYLDGENMTTVQARVVPALASLLAANLGRRIAVVAHNVVNRVYLTRLMNIPLRNYRAVPQENCGVNLIRYVQGEPTPVTINSVWHLLDP